MHEQGSITKCKRKLIGLTVSLMLFYNKTYTIGILFDSGWDRTTAMLLRDISISGIVGYLIQII